MGEAFDHRTVSRAALLLAAGQLVGEPLHPAGCDGQFIQQRIVRCAGLGQRAGSSLGGVRMLQKDLAFNLAGHVNHTVFWPGPTAI